MKTFLDVLEANPRPAPSAKRADKKNYAEGLSRDIAHLLANLLRRDFPGILPSSDGQGQESKARAARGLKKLDVNYSTVEFGLGLGVSVKTINYRDARSQRYTKNYSRVDNELRAEAKDYHQRQPYSVLVAVIFLPADAAEDGRPDNPSSFGSAIKYFRLRSGRSTPRNEEELFEGVFIGIYTHDGAERGRVLFFDVGIKPPKRGLPPEDSSLDLKGLARAITRIYDSRNNPPFEWANNS